jgi:hypothetical protein
VLTQKSQHRLHREYRSTKVAGCNLPDGALSVRDAWVGCKTRGFASVSFGRGLNLLGFLRPPKLHGLLLDELDLVAVGVFHEGDDGGAVLHGAGFARDPAAAFLHVFTGLVGVVHFRGDVAVAVAQFT